MFCVTKLHNLHGQLCCFTYREHIGAVRTKGLNKEERTYAPELYDSLIQGWLGL